MKDEITVSEYDYDDDGQTDVEYVLPAPGEMEYVVVRRSGGGQRIFIRDPSLDTDLPFVQIHPEFRVNGEWPEPPENYSVDLMDGSVIHDR